MRVFLDANVLFSASFANSHLATFLIELHKHAALLTNSYALAEARRNIAAKQPARVAAHGRFAESLELVPLKVFDPGVKLAEKDRPILCGAISGNANYLLTGDKRDFGHLFGKTVHGVKVATVDILLADLISLGIVGEE
jgi:predicted nucleic acid-binding protein